MNTMLRRSAPNCPPVLQANLAHAQRFARTLGAIHDDAVTEGAALLWLEGRADEVGAFARDVLRAWASDELGAEEAANAIEEYLHALHVTLEGWYGKWYAPSCCGPLGCAPPSGVQLVAKRAPRRSDPLFDTMADVPAPALDSETRECPTAPVVVVVRAQGRLSRLAPAHRGLRMGGVAVMEPGPAE